MCAHGRERAAASSPMAAMPAPAYRDIPATSGYSLGLRPIIAIAGAVLLIIGVFIPFIGVPMLGGVSLIQIGNFVQSLHDMMQNMMQSPLLAAGGLPGGGMAKIGEQLKQLEMVKLFLQGSAYFLLLLAGCSIAVALAKWANWLWLTGSAALAISLVIIGAYAVKVGAADQQIHKTMSALTNGPMGGLMGSAPKISLFAIVPLDWGAMFILLGAVVMLTAAALHDN